MYCRPNIIGAALSADRRATDVSSPLCAGKIRLSVISTVALSASCIPGAIRRHLLCFAWLCECHQLYEKSITSLNSNTRCTVYTKIGDSNANQALQENEKENRARLFRAASDSYQLCLNIDSKYGVATEHKAKVDQELANDEQVTKQLNQTNTTNSGVNNIESTDSTLQLEW